MSGARFDAAYYDRYYGQLKLAARVEPLVRFVCAYLEHLDISVDEVIDFGCGQGFWRAPLLRAHPHTRYTGVELSEHACETYGWEQGSVVDHELGRKADLVICQGVLQYLNQAQARRAIRNLARHTRGALYLEALTQEDWDHNCDQTATDGDVHLRPAAWYREQLSAHFFNCGGGLFVPRDSDVVMFELEKLV
ncbi:MAG TPA: class I SAM-dependent methyltransferase [Enhygromyxa sp.]|nr:class I SAM-dependent methyltransferase [Enhygromyxa sp.]